MWANRLPAACLWAEDECAVLASSIWDVWQLSTLHGSLVSHSSLIWWQLTIALMWHSQPAPWQLIGHYVMPLAWHKRCHHHPPCCMYSLSCHTEVHRWITSSVDKRLLSYAGCFMTTEHAHKQPCLLCDRLISVVGWVINGKYLLSMRASCLARLCSAHTPSFVQVFEGKGHSWLEKTRYCL